MQTVPYEILKLAARFAEHWARNPVIPTGKNGIPSWLQDAGFTKFSNGASRGALLGTDWIFKISLDPSRSEELEQELEVFQSYVGTPELVHLPHTEMVRQGRALVLIQERVLIDSKAWNQHRKEIDRVAGRFNMRDIHEGNIGFRVGATGDYTPVIIDLGEHVGLAPQAKQTARGGAPESLNKFVPNAADEAFLKGMANLGMDPTQWQGATHRRLR